MVDVAAPGSLPSELAADIERTGYYPALVSDALKTAIGTEKIDAYAINHEALFEADQIRRHITVMALTGTRLIVAHVDEHPAEQHPGQRTSASASTEAVRLDRVDSVVVTRVVTDPANYRAGTSPDEIVLTIGWGAVNRLELEPATCGDPSCEADHGFTGSSSNDDLSLRVSTAADGADAVTSMLTFAAALADATGING